MKPLLLFILQNPVEEIDKLSKFLDVKVDTELTEDIAEKCSFSSMKKEKDPMENKDEWKEGQPGMYRKGNRTVFAYTADI